MGGGDDEDDDDDDSDHGDSKLWWLNVVLGLQELLGGLLERIPFSGLHQYNVINSVGLVSRDSY